MEDSIDNNLSDRKNTMFGTYCPRCKTLSHQVASGRLKLLVKGFAKDCKFDPLTTRLADKLEIEPYQKENVQTNETRSHRKKQTIEQSENY